MTITYPLGDALYLNITNECPCDCAFCIRRVSEGIVPGQSLWLDHEPSIEEIMAAFAEVNFEKYREIVFCGYGEPTSRLEILVECAHFLKVNHNLPVRLNTNGLSDLINGKKTVPILAKVIDRVSISLNAADPESYKILCEPVFGEQSYHAMLQFARESKEVIPEVVMSVVGHSIDDATLVKCQDLCRSLDIPLRIR